MLQRVWIACWANWLEISVQHTLYDKRTNKMHWILIRHQEEAYIQTCSSSFFHSSIDAPLLQQGTQLSYKSPWPTLVQEQWRILTYVQRYHRGFPLLLLNSCSLALDILLHPTLCEKYFRLDRQLYITSKPTRVKCPPQGHKNAAEKIKQGDFETETLSTRVQCRNCSATLPSILWPIYTKIRSAEKTPLNEDFRLPDLRSTATIRYITWLLFHCTF